MVRVHVDQKADANRQGTANIDKTLNKDRVLYLKSLSHDNVL